MARHYLSAVQPVRCLFNVSTEQGTGLHPLQITLP